MSAIPPEAPLYCHWHPQVETGLRCYECETPICPKCAQRTPVGYLCRDCKKGRKSRFEQARPTDLLIAAVTALLLGGIAGWIMPMLGWFTIFLSPLAGTLIAEAVWRLVGRRFSEKLWWIVAAGIILGTLPLFLFSIIVGLLLTAGDPHSGWGFLSGLIWPAVHLFLTVGSAVARLRLH
ncbi:MAG TPA: hypothetical protein ENN14_00895 [Chloroflexi bacterium]|nr:hypothetical protein [Chloroflexota bacterium]